MNARLPFILIAIFCAATMAAGCGGSDASGESGQTPITTSSLSKPAYLKKANEVCRGGIYRIFNYRQPAKKRSEREIEEATIAKGLIPALRYISDGIQDLGAPQGDEAQVEAIVVAFGDAAVRIEESGVSSYPQAEKLLAHSSELAGNYGLQECVLN